MKHLRSTLFDDHALIKFYKLLVRGEKGGTGGRTFEPQTILHSFHQWADC